jgi:hypothetical protein
LCDLKRAENELKTTNISDQRLSLGENARFQKRAFSACSQDENDLDKNPGTRWNPPKLTHKTDLKQNLTLLKRFEISFNETAVKMHLEYF